MSDRLVAYLNGERVGGFTREASGISFRFDDDWRSRAGRMELSLSMPKSRREHGGTAPENYLWNLLPDNESVLERWGSRFSVSPRNPMALLEHVGLDTAGAVQLSTHDAPTLDGPAGYEPIDEHGIAAHIRELRRDPGAWFGHGDGYFSLAGAQPKFTLARVDDQWATPTGLAASTHILKPGVHGLANSDLDEHLTLVAAAGLGLEVAESRIRRFDDETAIVVTRYDRITDDDGTIRRQHQEDLAQAMGVHPARKYQSEGGPGIVRVADRIRASRGRDAEDGVVRFFEAVMFNWAALGTDAHVKNYSLVHDARRGPRLAPLYDLATALPYPGLNGRGSRLAMSFGGHYKLYEIEPRHILADAVAVGLDPEWALARARDLVNGLTDAYAEAAAEADLDGEDAAFAGSIVDAAAARTARLRRELDRVDSVPAAKPSRTRHRATGTEGKPGAFAPKPRDP